MRPTQQTPRPEDGPCAQGGEWYRSTSRVRANVPTAPHLWTASSGVTLVGEVGDVLLVDPAGSQRTIKPAIFAVTYTRVGGGWFAKSALTFLIPIHGDVTVSTLEGPAPGNGGDFLAVGATGERWPVSAQYVRENYVRVAPPPQRARVVSDVSEPGPRGTGLAPEGRGAGELATRS